ncbi:MAG TPA: TonB-dependent siderophore receptor [Blastocatellia bacterium]|nr:TonB-dependent siderophore receptor [Blastocatellia bacterium]
MLWFSRRFAKLFFIVMATGIILGQAHAESPEFTLRGKVLDPDQAPIAGAQITATPDGSPSSYSTVSNTFGEFSLLLKPGHYTVHIFANGFEETAKAISLATGATEYLEIGLQIAAPHDTITIVGTDYLEPAISSATRTLTALRDTPQSITVVTREQIKDQQMLSLGDVVRYVPGVTVHQGENNRDQIIFRGNSSSADFFLNGVRDDVQYYRDLYNLDAVEILRGPNAMIFGRGGGGGVINRVSKEAGFAPLREVTLLGGGYGNKRVAVDLDQPISGRMAFRLNAMYENSGSFRDFVNLERYGISPTMTLMPNERTKVTLSYENFRDHRTADRGIPSFQGKPVAVDIATFFGNPDESRVRALVNLGTAAIEHQRGRLNIRNRAQFGGYDRFYQNFVPGQVTADQMQAALTAYNNATERLNIFNQTDLTYSLSTGNVRHTLLGGVEVGRQLTDNFRNTGFFNNTVTSIFVPLSDPTVRMPMTFRQNATDADNHLKVNVAATYAQDQIELSRYIQVIAGLRFDRFDLQYHNRRNDDHLRRTDHLVSPRAGVIFKPVTPISVYGNYSVSYLPSSGDQFSSLTMITQQVKPEKFSNYEIGLKWDITRALSLTTAGYRLNRNNTRATDPNDPTRIIQTGSQRTNGYEIGLNGNMTRAWRIAGGYAFQDAFITRDTVAARAGAQVAQVPHQTFSLWNNYQILARLSAGLGLIRRSDMFAAVDNKVTLPGYTRADAAVFFRLTEKLRLQANVENLLDKRYYLNADSNTNISPGAARTLRVGLTARF